MALDRAFRERRRGRDEIRDETLPHAWTPKRLAILDGFVGDEIRDEIPEAVERDENGRITNVVTVRRDEIRDETRIDGWYDSDTGHFHPCRRNEIGSRSQRRSVPMKMQRHRPSDADVGADIEQPRRFRGEAD
jgi:hypothetical protein